MRDVPMERAAKLIYSSRDAQEAYVRWGKAKKLPQFFRAGGLVGQAIVIPFAFLPDRYFELVAALAVSLGFWSACLVYEYKAEKARKELMNILEDRPND